MKTTIQSQFVALMIVGAVGLFACNKNASSSGNSSDATSTSALQTSADDQSQISYESDAVDDDETTALNGNVSVAGSSINSVKGMGAVTTEGMGAVQVDSVGDTVVTNTSLICDATITYADTNGARTVTITYNGSNCNGTRTRTGTITISIPNGVWWKDAGAAVTVNISNLTITRLRDNKTWIINGTRTYTNVSGGLLVDLPNLSSITHTISGSMSITFANGNVREWDFARQRVFTYNDGIVATTTGMHTDTANNTNVAMWGVNRYGISFENLITEPKVIAQSCEYRLTAGQDEILRSDNWDAMITYGLDGNGDATGCPGTGTYYYKLVVTSPRGVTYTYILPY